MSAAPDSNTNDSARRVPALWPILIGIVVYPLLRFGGPSLGKGLLANLVPVALAYALAIYLYYGIPGLAYRRIIWPIGIAAFASVVVAIATIDQRFVGQALLELAAVVIAGGLTGLLTRTNRHPLVTYVVSAIIVSGLSVLFYLPIWSGIMKDMTALLEQFTASSKEMIAASGGTPEEVQEFGERISKLVPVIVTLLPAVTIMTMVIQYSLGFLLFFKRVAVNNPHRRSVLSFTGWRVPYEFIPVVIVLILMRLFAGHVPKLIADNGIFLLSIFYCLSGLSLVEFYLKRWQLTLPFRIVFYTFLFLTGFVGFIVIAIIGFIDSFTDWRSRSGPEIDLKKNIQ